MAKMSARGLVAHMANVARLHAAAHDEQAAIVADRVQQATDARLAPTEGGSDAGTGDAVQSAPGTRPDGVPDVPAG